MIDTHNPAIASKPIDREGSFSFACHKGVSCFTECCRMLELTLSPYDLLRLRYSTGKTSTELLDQFVIMEQAPGDAFPRFYLTMIDDGRASCVFVSSMGCTVYPDRPAACRTYPLGRGVQKATDGTLYEHFVLVEEHHCRGFMETVMQTPLEYMTDQELSRYNHFNDLLAAILQHDAIRKGFRPSQKQQELFTLALYDLDRFRQMIEKNDIRFSPAAGLEIGDDEQLLEASIHWISTQLFARFG